MLTSISEWLASNAPTSFSQMATSAEQITFSSAAPAAPGQDGQRDTGRDGGGTIFVAFLLASLGWCLPVHYHSSQIQCVSTKLPRFFSRAVATQYHRCKAVRESYRGE